MKKEDCYCQSSDHTFLLSILSCWFCCMMRSRSCRTLSASSCAFASASSRSFWSSACFTASSSACLTRSSSALRASSSSLIFLSSASFFSSSRRISRASSSKRFSSSFLSLGDKLSVNYEWNIDILRGQNRQKAYPNTYFSSSSLCILSCSSRSLCSRISRRFSARILAASAAELVPVDAEV